MKVWKKPKYNFWINILVFYTYILKFVHDKQNLYMERHWRKTTSDNRKWIIFYLLIIPDTQIKAFKQKVEAGCWYSSKLMLWKFQNFSRKLSVAGSIFRQFKGKKFSNWLKAFWNIFWKQIRRVYQSWFWKNINSCWVCCFVPPRLEPASVVGNTCIMQDIYFGLENYRTLKTKVDLTLDGM